ncbi:MAG TPA: hypothetical protein VN673_14380 [Clostridia bacterium]|nr:hypothetical protein [Clostridia bacterium]
MVIAKRTTKAREAWLMLELLAAMALLTAALLPLAHSFASEKKLARSQYQRAVAMELVDGEFEVLAAGEWRTYGTGTHRYEVSAGAATNLPPGKFTLTVRPPSLRLEWKPAVKMHGGPIVREGTIE